MRVALLSAVLAAVVTETFSNRASAPLCGELATRLGSLKGTAARMRQAMEINATTQMQ